MYVNKIILEMVLNENVYIGKIRCKFTRMQIYQHTGSIFIKLKMSLFQKPFDFISTVWNSLKNFQEKIREIDDIAIHLM